MRKAYAWWLSASGCIAFDQSPGRNPWRLIRFNIAFIFIYLYNYTNKLRSYINFILSLY